MSRFPLRLGATCTSLTAHTFAFGLVLAAHPVSGPSISGASVSTSGSTGSSGDGSGSIRSSLYKDKAD